MVRTFSTGSKSSKAANVNEVIADTAYSTLENLKDAQSNDYKLISKQPEHHKRDSFRGRLYL